VQLASDSITLVATPERRPRNTCSHSRVFSSSPRCLPTLRKSLSTSGRATPRCFSGSARGFIPCERCLASFRTTKQSCPLAMTAS
jgi:hypothetical protein